MKKLLDTMYYQHVLSDEAKQSGTVFEDVTSVPRKDKIRGLLAEHANLTAIVVALHENMSDQVDALITAALADEDIREAAEDDDDIAQAIQDTEAVTDLFDSFEQAEQQLVDFEDQLAEALCQESV